MQIQNPVLPGFNSDPSIIRVGDTYYIATSTFEWFPGVRIHASKDLVHWNLVKNVLNTTQMLDMKGNPSSGSIWAPDLSYADGKFWLIFTDVKITDGNFKDMKNYLTTSETIEGPWSEPLLVNGVGFDASLFHDDDGRKYLVQQTWDHREYHHPFDGITLTEFNTENMKLKPETARTIFGGTEVKLVEGPHLYKINDEYFLFTAEGGTIFTHQEVVSRSKSLEAMSFVVEPKGPFVTNFDTPNAYLQKQGHGALVSTPGGEWYYASLSARPWHHEQESANDPRGWSTLGRETSIQKVVWDDDGWPRIVGGHGGQTLVAAPEDAILTEAPSDHSQHDEFNTDKLDSNWNTLRVPFTEIMGVTGHGKLTLIGQGSLANTFDLSLIARRWQAFYFDAETKVKFQPYSYQAMAGLTNYYNHSHWSWVFVTKNDDGQNVIEVGENKGGLRNGTYTSYLRDNAPIIPDDTEYVYFKSENRKSFYTYFYSFDGAHWITTGVTLDAAVLSDDYVVGEYGGFFTGAFIGLAAVDYSGYKSTAEFDYFDYKELGDFKETDGSFSWRKSELRFY
ncbi:glycoside hydrolase family 43 protein [Leuconostoc citreum]|uniref:glycoside hydrolase family 43 protein n=1 Tax=Leuconostoc citreum TaxID=33964 RepID=UPI0021A29420|nr:glycoside hydrolase family 43 protein [Leuconostoc citreum]MCT3055237.1 glycoside hydrolase family 43 protein [Leuconostoc citreum]MCT3063244.1 glycoside hydrolase family 43 protein [Leuconostoc citreum]